VKEEEEEEDEIDKQKKLIKSMKNGGNKESKTPAPAKSSQVGVVCVYLEYNVYKCLYNS
jgi:hypothetical protein